MAGIGAEAYSEASDAYNLESSKVDAYIEAAGEAGVNIEAISAMREEGEMDTAVINEFETAAAAVPVEGTLDIYNDDTGEVEETLTVTADDFAEAIETEEPDPNAYGVWVPGIPVLVGNGLNAIHCAAWLRI